MIRATTRCPLGGDVFTDEALASMVGREVPLTVAFDRARHLGRATVVEATISGADLLLTIEYDEATARRLEEAGVPLTLGGVGYQVHQSTVREGVRVFEDVTLREVAPLPPPVAHEDRP